MLFRIKHLNHKLYQQKKLVIPLQQREYDWSSGTNITELLSDLDQHLLNLQSTSGIPQDPLTTSDYYYSGTILCENQNNDTLKLIDGQQRVTTLYLINFTGYLLSKLKFYTIPPSVSPTKYQRLLVARFNNFTKWESRCFIKKNLSDNLTDFDDEDTEKTETQSETEIQINNSILERIGDKKNNSNIKYWPNLEPRLSFSDTVEILPKFIKAINEAEILIKDDSLTILTLNELKNNPYILGLNIIIKFLNEKIQEPKPSIDESIQMMLEHLEFYISHLSMTCIISENENDSFTLFEILNERGLDITALDLLKNLIKEREQSPGAFPITDFPSRWKNIKANVKNSGAKGKSDSNFVKFLIRSEANTAEKKQISYLRTNFSSPIRFDVFCNESISHFFLRLQKCSEIIFELNNNATQDPDTNSSPFDNDKHTCFQYSTFMRMIGYEWGQQVIIGSNLLHLVSSNYSFSPNPSYSLNDNHPNNWKNSNSNPSNPDLRHFQRFLGDIMLKIGIIGVVNKLSSNALPECSKAILSKIINCVSLNGQDCNNPINLKNLMNEIIIESNKIINRSQKDIFTNRLKSEFLADTAPKKNIAKIILYLIYTRNSSLIFNCPELEHFEPNSDTFSGPGYYNKGDRSIIINRIGNFFLIDRVINRDFSNHPIWKKLEIASSKHSNNSMVQSNLFQNINYYRIPPVLADISHGVLPLIQKATGTITGLDDSFELDNSPTKVFFEKRSKLISELAANYIFDNNNFISTNSSY